MRTNRFIFFLINMFTIIMLVMWMMIIWGHKDMENSKLENEISIQDSILQEQNYKILNYEHFIRSNEEIKEEFKHYHNISKSTYLKKYPDAILKYSDIQSRIVMIAGFGTAFAALIILFFVILYRVLGHHKHPIDDLFKNSCYEK